MSRISLIPSTLIVPKSNSGKAFAWKSFTLNASSVVEFKSLINANRMRRSEVTQVAKSWQGLGGLKVVDILQKLTTDLLRCRLTQSPQNVFFPVQISWVQSSSAKLSKIKLLEAIDELNYAKRMLATTVDELLVLETVCNKMKNLPV